LNLRGEKCWLFSTEIMIYELKFNGFLVKFWVAIGKDFLLVFRNSYN
jgi:hypothetical protein